MSLRDYEGDKVAIWLAYFQAPSRRKGRKIGKLSNKKIDLNTIYEITKRLELEPEIFQDKIHPASGIVGLIMVKKKHGKYKLIKLIVDEINKLK
jgi:signal recognition particle subunit SRP19